MRFSVFAVALLYGLLLSISSTSANSKVDQSVIGPWHGSFNLLNGLSQTFRPEATTLTGVKVALTRMGQGDTTVTLTVRSGGLEGPVIGSSTRFIENYAAGQPSDFDSGIRLEHFGFVTPPPTVPGEIYVIHLEADNGGLGWVNPGFDGYPEGNAYWGNQAITAWDFMFQTCGDGEGRKCKAKTQYVTTSGEIRPSLPRAHAKGHKGCIDFDDEEVCEP